MTLSYCPRIKNVIASWDFKPGYLAVARMRCRQWDCAYCSIKNADMWRAHLLETFCHTLVDERWIFITLTVPASAHALDPAISLGLLKKAWKRVYDALRWRNGGGLKYVLVFETHKSGIFHAHCLCNLGTAYDAYGVSVELEQSREKRFKDEREHPFAKWLSGKAVDAGLGWVLHVTRIREGANGGDNARLAVGYICKYFTKGVGEMAFPKRARRIQTSQDIGSPRSKNKSKYSWVLKPAISWQSSKAIPHWLISEGRVLGAADFGDDGYYPPIEG